MSFPSQSPVDAFTPAIQRTTALLFKPFRWSFYWRMAVVAFLTGELGGGSFRFPTSFPTDHRRQRGGSNEFLSGFPLHLPGSLSVTTWIMIAVAVVLLFFVFMVIFTYIASVFRFILFDSVLGGSC